MFRLPAAVVGTFLSLLVTAPTLAGGTTRVATEGEQRASSLHQRLETVDRELQRRLSQIVRNAEAPTIDRFRRDSEYFRGALEQLEREAQLLGAAATPLVSKLDRLGALVSNLEHAATGADPSGALPRSHRRHSVAAAPGAIRHLPSDAGNPPANDDCSGAQLLTLGQTVVGDTSEATQDGQAGCGSSLFSNDVWFRYVPEQSGGVTVDTFGSEYDTVLSVHTGCPGTLSNEIECNDDAFGVQSAVYFYAVAGFEYWIRLSGFDQATGPYELHIGSGATVSGTVTDDDDGTPLADGEIRLWSPDGYYAGSSTTDAAGAYTLPTTEAGAYTMTTRSFAGYFDELYDDLPCPGSSCTVTEGTPIMVASHGTVPDIDFALEEGGAVEGTVTDAVTSEPIVNARVEIWDDEQTYSPIATDYTDDRGAYRVEGLVEGTYFAVAEIPGYQNELYDDLPCPGSVPWDCDPTTGTPIQVQNPETTAGIDFALDRFGSISGLVVDNLTGEPIAGLQVSVRRIDGSYSEGSDSTDDNGTYLIGGLMPDQYVAFTNSAVYADELYDNIPCPQGFHGDDCDPEDGTPILVELNTETTGINFALDPGAEITGSVTEAGTGNPVSLYVEIYTSDGTYVDQGYTDSWGQYSVGDLPADTYVAKTDSYNTHLNELYDDIPCAAGCDPTAGTPIPAAVGSTTTGIDFSLVRNGSIAGTVIDAGTGLPLAIASIQVWNETGVAVGYEHVDSLGQYTVNGLNPGTYFVSAGGYDYVEELYDDIPCGRHGCVPTTGTPVPVALDSTTQGIDFDLHRAGEITTTVLDASTGMPLFNVQIGLWDEDSDYLTSCWTGSLGACTLDGILPGTYYAATSANSSYLDEVYDGIPCLGGPYSGCDPTKGTPIVMTAGTAVFEIDFHLMLFDSGIAGRVHGDGRPLTGVEVDVWDAAGNWAASTTSLATGEYFVRLDPGTYTVSTDNQLGYMDELFDDVPCPEGSAGVGLCDPRLGQPITVDESGPQMIVVGVDFELRSALFQDGFESGDLSAW